MTATCDGDGNWTVHEPDAPPEADYIQDYLNARYGHSRLITSGTVPALVQMAVRDLNLSMRHRMRRFTRRSMGFSRKMENHAHMVDLHFLVCNFCRSCPNRS